MRTWILLTLTVGLFVGHSRLRADEKRSDAEALQGTWRVMAQQRAGRATALPRNMLWIVEGETIWLVPGWLAAKSGQEANSGGKKVATKRPDQPGGGGKKSGAPRGLRMTFQINPSKGPKEINIDGPKKAASYGIYKLEGDDWIICMGVTQPSPSYDKGAKGDETTRPVALSSEAGTVIILKRVRD